MRVMMWLTMHVRWTGRATSMSVVGQAGRGDDEMDASPHLRIITLLECCLFVVKAPHASRSLCPCPI